MELSRHILKEFADVSRGVEREDKTQYLRGTIKSSGKAKYVRIDGSESLTPISEIVDVKDGDRVLVTIENHEATILGNLTKPPSAYKEQEAIDKAENAQGTAGEAVEKAENAESLAQSAGNKADAALVDATNASAAANQAKQDASEAITAAGNASKNSTEAKQLATAAGQNAETARQEAALAQNAATAAQGEVTRIQGVVTDVKGDIDTALQEVADQAADLQATKETLEVTYAKKTEVSDVQAALTTEISKKVGELQTTVSQTYAAKNDVVAMEGRLQSQITQTSGEISSVVGKVEQLESDTTEAQKKVDEALEKSAAAQVAAGQAQANASASQAAADAAKANADTATKKANEAAQNAATAAATAAEADKKVSAAKTDLAEAKENLANTINRVGATEQEIADAQKKVDAAQAAVTQAQIDAAEATAAANNAQNAANKAQTDATEAQNSATNAQKKADNAALAAGNAQAAADKAQQDVAALTKRVVSAETAITQNSEEIKLAATKTEEIGNKIDSQQSGGVNLWRFTKDYDGSKYDKWGQIGATQIYYKNWRPITTIDGFGVQYITTAWDDMSQRVPVKPNTEYTLSAMIRLGDENSRVGFYVDNGTRLNILVDGQMQPVQATVNGLSATEYRRVSATFNTGNANYSYARFEPQDNSSMYMYQPMLNEGKPKPWSPHPEDTQSQIDGINNNLQNNYYSKTQTDAAIKVAADNVTTTVRKEVTTEITNVNNKVDNLRVGGRNLLTKDILGNFRGRVLTNNSDGSITTTHYYQNDSALTNLKAGDTLTFSCKLKKESDFEGNKVRIGIYHDGTWDSYYMGDLLTTSYKMFSKTITMQNDGDIRLVIQNDNGSSVDTEKITFKELKLEIGNKATDYSPAPEDMATAEQAQQAQNDANNANSKADATEQRVSVAESTIKQLSDSISMLVTDSNGSSMMTQTSDGWTFNIGAITSAIDSATNNIDNLSGSLSKTNNVVNNLNNLANDLSKKTAYINMTTDETGAPCIELGKTGNAFKVRITNTSVDFIEGSSKIAYVSNQALFIEKAIIKNELQIGGTFGFVWQTRSNGNLGLRYIDPRPVFSAIAKYPQSSIDVYSTKDRYENFNISENPTGCPLGSTIKIKVFNTTTNVYNYIECILININSTTQIRIKATGIVTLC